MKLFKSIDEKFEEIGFAKVEQNNYGVIYERENTKHNYKQTLHLLHKENGKHLIQSYDKTLMDKKGIGNTGVGLTMYEAKLCIKKMKEIGWKITR